VNGLFEGALVRDCDCLGGMCVFNTCPACTQPTQPTHPTSPSIQRLTVHVDDGLHDVTKVGVAQVRHHLGGGGSNGGAQPGWGGVVGVCLGCV